MPAKKSTPHQGELTSQAEQAMPAWIVAMRRAAREHITEQDIQEIVANQVKAAKKGDRNAIRFVFDQVLGGAAFKGATFVQNNYGADGSRIEDLVKSGPLEKKAKLARAAEVQAAIDEPLRWFCNGCGEEADTKGAKPEESCFKCGSHQWRPVAAERRDIPSGEEE